MPVDGRTELLTMLFRWLACPRGTFPGEFVKGYGRTIQIVTKLCGACIIHHQKLLTFGVLLCYSLVMSASLTASSLISNDGAGPNILPIACP